ncbi:Uncharacterised protein [Vibrio cholerae]|nr:Uncharacterised protein [Vibrio cholerae]
MGCFSLHQFLRVYCLNRCVQRRCSHCIFQRTLWFRLHTSHWLHCSKPPNGLPHEPAAQSSSNQEH